MDKEIVELGDKVEDSVTGFKGTAVAITTWMYGCRRVIVKPAGVDKDGKTYPDEAFDEPQMKIIKRANVPKAERKKRLDKGGPHSGVSVTSRN